MWAIGIINLGSDGRTIALGSEGMGKLRNRTLRGWRSETEVMRKCADEVYVVSDITQEMCEMGNGNLADYVCRTGKRIY